MNSYQICISLLATAVNLHFGIASSVNTTLPKNYPEYLKYINSSYEKLLRPNIVGSPLNISFNLYVESMGQFKSVEETYSISMYLRLKWIDPRLAYWPSKEFGNFIALSQDLIPDIWTPNIHITNEKNTYLHKLLDFNQLVYIWPNGSLLLSSKMTVTLGCQMDLSSFPLDKQLCELNIASYGYSDLDTHYSWQYEDAKDNVHFEEKDFTDPSFTLKKIKTNSVQKYYSGLGNFTTLGVHFHLERRIGFYIMNLYIPASVLVFISWLSFWVHNSQTAARVGLGITTTLSLLTVNYGIQSSLPKVNYPKAIDWFLICCLAMVFGSLVEYGIVHALKLIDERKITKVSMLTVKKGLQAMRESFKKRSSLDLEKGNSSQCLNSNIEECEMEEIRKSQNGQSTDPPEVSTISSKKKIFKSWGKSYSLRPKKNTLSKKEAELQVSIVDKLARVFFPLVFIILNVFYWAWFVVFKYDNEDS